MKIGKMTVQEFCDKYDACAEGKDWAIKTGAANMAELWKRADMRVEWRLWIFEHSDVDKKTAVRLAVFCARQNWHLLTDQRSKDAVETVERWLDGKATIDEVRAASDAALAAARDAARAAAWAAASAAASAAARDAEWASRAAAWAARDAARAAAWAAVWAAASAAASAAARDAQNEWLIKNVEI